MKKILLFILINLILCSLLQAIDVSGTQSGTWSPDNNPHNIVGDITIPETESLTIQSGVEVYSQGNYKITALGFIHANGTASDSITFSGENDQYWGGIRLENSIETSIFAHCSISNTNDMNDYGIQSVASPVNIHYCYFNDHKKAVSFSGLSTDDPPYMEIYGSKISNCEQNGITITDNSNALIDSCEITQCGLGTQYRGAIQLSLQSSSHNCSPIITNNEIHHNGKQGIIFGNMFNYTEMAPTVEMNNVHHNLTGIYLYNATGTYSGNHIHDNYIENDPNTGAGVMLYGSGANGTFTENHVHGNYSGFFIGEGATANLGNLDNASTEDDGLNMIHDNIFFDGTIFSVVNNSAEDIKAENNVWDYLASHDSTIVDSNDDPAYGTVDYTPYLTPFPPPDSAYYQEGNIHFVLPSTPYYRGIVGINVYIDEEVTNYDFQNPLFIDNIPPGIDEIGVSFVYEGDYESEIIIINITGTDTDSELKRSQSARAYPNPFKNSTKISFLNKSINTESRIQIFNIKGQLIKKLTLQSSDDNKVYTIWNGTDEKGTSQSSGIYFGKLKTDDTLEFIKIMKLE